MHPNFHEFLYDFFIKGHDLNYIAGTYESSWYEVAEVLDSELARKYMRSAIRVQNIRAAGTLLRSRLSAIQTLHSTITERDDRSHSSTEARRRAATAILNGARPNTKSRTASTARSKPVQPALSETPASPTGSKVRSPAAADAPKPRTHAIASTKSPATSKAPRPSAHLKPASSASQPRAPDPSLQSKTASSAQPPRFPVGAPKPRSNFKTRRARPQSNARAKPRRENSS